MELELEMDSLTKKGEIFEALNGQLIFVCCICNATNFGLNEVENHLKTHIELVVADSFLGPEHTTRDSKPGRYDEIKCEVDIDHLKDPDDSMQLDIVIDIPSPTNNGSTKREPDMENEGISTATFVKQSTNVRSKSKNSSRRFFPIFDQFKCDICGKIFTNRKSLKTHVERHSGNKPHGCDICGNMFADKKNLKHHVKRHDRSRKFHCDQCGKRFITPPDLNRHILRHSGDRNFMCTTCGKRYSTNYELTIHIRRVHANERRFKCKFTGCQQSYFSSNKLKVHERCHTGERPLNCHVCNRSFANPNILRKHLQLHSEKQHQCTFCPSKFVQPSQKRNHERRVHGAS